MNIDLLKIQCDYETGISSGSGGFQVISVIGVDSLGKEIDLTKRIDQGYHYYKLEDVARDLDLIGIYIEEE